MIKIITTILNKLVKNKKNLNKSNNNINVVLFIFYLYVFFNMCEIVKYDD